MCNRDQREFASLTENIRSTGQGIHRAFRASRRYLPFVLVMLGAALLIAAPAFGTRVLSAGDIVLVLGVACLALALVLGSPSQTSGAGPEQGVENGLERLKDAEWRLRDDESRYRELLDSQTDIIVRVDGGGRITFVNKAFCRLLGREPQAILGTPLSFAAQGRPPIDLAGLLDAGTASIEHSVVTAVGPRLIAFEILSLDNTTGQGVEHRIVGRDVTEERATEAKLARARDEAEAANRAKSRFLAAMSHEIRTPMNGILGMAGLLGETELNAEQRAYAQAIDQSAKTLLNIIDEILDLSKIEAGRLEMHPVPFAIDTSLQGVAELLAPKAREKNIELVWRIEPALPRLLIGDETRLRQILLNLVGNAIKFTDRGGVAVRLRQCSAEVEERHITIEVEVADTGIGIAPDQLCLIFGEFEQITDPVARRRGGTGLGLAISRRLARAMKGDITVESSPGSGSRFIARLRLERATSAAPVLPVSAEAGHPRVLLAVSRPIERQVLTECLHSLGAAVEIVEAAAVVEVVRQNSRQGRSFDVLITDAGVETTGPDDLVHQLRAAAPKPIRCLVLIDPTGRAGLGRLRAAGYDAYLVRPVRPASLASQIGIGSSPLVVPSGAEPRAQSRSSSPYRSRTILLVEDNDINALLARRVGERTGCTMHHAKSGPEAVAICAEMLADRVDPPIDLVLMDIHMPEMDGFEATRLIRQTYAAAGRSAPPVAALTANAFPEDRRRCLDEGLDDFLAKPFERRELEALLDKWCAGRGPGSDGHLDDCAA
jgi:two-component system, sensor histidine kinase and response regulator